MNKYSILATIIVNYKLEERTIKYVKEELLHKCSLPNIIVIVNNGATVSSTQILASTLGAVVVEDISKPLFNLKNIYVIHNIENSGFARGNNLGVDFLVGHFEVEYLLFSNNDISFIDNEVIEKLLSKLASDNKIGVIGPRVIGLDGKCQSPYIYTSFFDEILWMSWGRFLPFWKPEELNRDLAKEGVYYRLIGAFFIVPLKYYLACGKMDPHTFLYGEEVILAERMQKIGKSNYYFPQVSVLHEHGLTTSMLSEDNKFLLDSILYYFKTYKNESSFNLFIGKITVNTYYKIRSLARRMKRFLIQ